MKLARKLTWSIIAGMSLILAAAGVLTVRRESRMLERDMQRDHMSIGRLAAIAMAERNTSLWNAALGRIGQAFENNGTMKLRRVDAIPAAGPGLHGGRYYSYVPLPSGTPITGFVEVSESVAEESLFVRESTIRTLVLTLLSALSAALLSALLGYRLIGKPVRMLAEKARRVGEGHLDDPLLLPHRDELGDLAREMNLMCDRLRDANMRVATEAKARIDAMEALRHADRLATVGQLASGIAHELGTPLNVISARARMVQDREGTLDELSGYGRVIAEQSSRITRIIRQLLDFARGRKAGQATTSASKVTFDLRHIAKNMCAMLAPLADKRGVVLACPDDGHPALSIGDQGSIEQAVTNLVVNAIQASSSGGTISLQVEACNTKPPPDLGGDESAYLRLTVRDQGGGVAPENLERIFEPFFTTKKVGEGTGLGLSVAYGIAREHFGWITAESQLGQGSAFSLYLPERPT